MRIFIDIGHPAHVHYFRNFIKLMEQNGHKFLVSARNRSIIHYLLNNYEIAYFSRGKGKNSILGKLLYMLVADFRIFQKARKFNPEIFLSFASPYAAQVSWLMKRPHIVLDDTEHAKFGQLFYKPFSSVFLNPSCFRKNFGKNQIRFESFMELCYLHPDVYKPDTEIINLLGLKKNEKFVLLRFVSWQAHHDYGQSGLDNVTKTKLVKLLSDKYRVFISKEASNDEFLAEHELDIPFEKIHAFLYHADIFITESGTMASEAALLGTPVVYINSLPLMGYLQEEKESGLLFYYPDSEGVIEKVKEFKNHENLKEITSTKLHQLLDKKINPTSFLIWFIENYPESFQIMKENPDYQYKFKNHVSLT